MTSWSSTSPPELELTRHRSLCYLYPHLGTRVLKLRVTSFQNLGQSFQNLGQSFTKRKYHLHCPRRARPSSGDGKIAVRNR